VSVFEITQQQFEMVTLPSPGEVSHLGESEVAWFTDAADSLLGVLICNAHGDCWGYSIWARNRDGVYERVAQGAEILAEGVAKRELVRTMQRHEGSSPTSDWQTSEAFE